jgi:hypothetical protein
VTATAPPGDFVAVYDKILLERALEYCNNDAGIADWTRYTDGVTITDSVAYSWGCADSIEDFNLDLNYQRTAINAYYSDDTSVNAEYPANYTIICATPEPNGPYTEEDYPEGQCNPDPELHRDWFPWDFTVAPGEGDDRWHNYIKGLYNPEMETYNAITINGKTYYPYLPGLSSYKLNVLNNYHDYDAKRSAGVDCSGYIQKCAGYTDNPYISIPDITERIYWGGGSENLIAPAGFASNEYTWPIEDSNLLVPGDIISCDGHVAMIWKIEYDDNSRIVTEDNVYLIEAQGVDMSVTNFRDWKYLVDRPASFPNITKRRLKTD